MTRTTILIVLTLISAAALGYEVGRISAPKVSREHSSGDVSQVPQAQISQLRAQRSPLGEVDVTTAPFEIVLQAIVSAKPEQLADYAKRIELIKQKPARWAAIATFFKTLIQIDPVAAKTLILQLPKEDRFVALIEVKDAAPPAAMPQVVEILMGYDPIEISGCSFNYLTDALQKWSEGDPAAVRQFFETHPDKDLEGHYPNMIAEWAAYEPEAARDWMNAQIKVIRKKDEATYDPESLPSAMESAWLEGLFHFNHKAAFDYVASRPDQDAGRFAAHLVTMLFVESPEQAKAFVSGLPSAVQAGALSGVTPIADRTVYGDSDDQTRSPEFVANWMLQFPSELWCEHIDNVITEWRYKDTDTLFAWISSLEPATQEIVVSKYDPYLPPDIAEKEFNSVMNVSDGVLREKLLEQIMQHADQSRGIISAALDKAYLSSEQKAYLRSLIPEQQYEIAASDDD